MHNPFEEYYLNQARNNVQYGGRLPGFMGARMQRGYGLGSIFKGFIRNALPLAKTGAKILGKSLLKTGANIVKDVVKGKEFKQALKRRGKQAGREFLGTLQSQIGRGQKRKCGCDPNAARKRKRRRTTPSQKGIKGLPSPVQRPEYRDIFS